MTLLALALAALIGWAFFTYILKRKLAWSFSRTPVRTASYFLLLTVLVGWMVPEAAIALYSTPTLGALVFLALTLLVVNPLLYAMARDRAREDVHIDLELLRLDMRFLISKPADVLFQQTVFGVLLLVASTTLSLPYVIGLFALAFGLFHLGLFLRMPQGWALYFLASAIVVCVPLAYLLLFVPGGIYYALALHMLWYVVSGAVLAGKTRPLHT